VGVARGALCALALLAGCASSPSGPEWSHPEKDALELKADQADCARFFSSSDQEQERCLLAKGWKKADKKRGGFSLF